MYATSSDYVALPNGWPVYPTPVDCARCGGRIHQMSLHADSWCSGCIAEGARLFPDARASWYDEQAAA
jgi:hypothetical protein